jgi:hypothetical protein
MYASTNTVRVIKSRRMRWVSHVACVGEMRNIYKILIGKPEGKKPRGRPRRRWADLREIGWEDVNWMLLAQNRYQ